MTTRHLLLTLTLLAPLPALAQAPEGKSWLHKAVSLQACMEAIADRAVREDVALDYCLSIASTRPEKPAEAR